MTGMFLNSWTGSLLHVSTSRRLCDHTLRHARTITDCDGVVDRQSCRNTKGVLSVWLTPEPIP